MGMGDGRALSVGALSVGSPSVGALSVGRRAGNETPAPRTAVFTARFIR